MDLQSSSRARRNRSAKTEAFVPRLTTLAPIFWVGQCAGADAVGQGAAAYGAREEARAVSRASTVE